MPGSVPNASPVEVFPEILYRAMQHARAYPALVNEYRNGESQRSLLASTSRKRFEFEALLAPSGAATVRTFFQDRKGTHEPFYFYYGPETSPKFSHDPTGVATTGRYTVRMDGFWEQQAGIARVLFRMAMVELS